MESMADTLAAFLAGIQAERRTVTRPKAAAISRDSGEILRTSWDFVPPAQRALSTSLEKTKVSPMPAMPRRIPRGMPMPLKTSASKRTLERICFFVAPTDFSSPNCFVRSLMEMEKAL